MKHNASTQDYQSSLSHIPDADLGVVCRTINYHHRCKYATDTLIHAPTSTAQRIIYHAPQISAETPNPDHIYPAFTISHRTPSHTHLSLFIGSCNALTANQFHTHTSRRQATPHRAFGHSSHISTKRLCLMYMHIHLTLYTTG